MSSTTLMSLDEPDFVGLRRMSLADFIIDQTQIQISVATKKNSLMKTCKRWRIFWWVNFTKKFSIDDNLQQQLTYLKFVIVQFVTECRILIITSVLPAVRVESLLIWRNNVLNFPAKYFLYDQNQMTEKMYSSQMKFILISDHKDNSELSGDQVRDTVQTVYKNEICNETMSLAAWRSQWNSQLILDHSQEQTCESQKSFSEELFRTAQSYTEAMSMILMRLIRMIKLTCCLETTSYFWMLLFFLFVRLAHLL